MISWLLGCVVLALKVFIGSMIITVGSWILVGIIAVIAFSIKEIFKL